MNEILRNTLFSIPALTGIVFLVIGAVAAVYPAKRINRIVGYRTPRSMKSQKAWEFAQVYSARLMLKLSICLLSVAAIGFAVGNIGILGAALGFLSFIFASGAVIILTERKLRALEVSSSGEVMQP